MNRCILVFSKYNQRSVLASLRFFESNDISYCIICYDKNDILVKSKYGHRIIHYLQDERLSVDEIKKVLIETGEAESVTEWILLPTTEYLNRFFLANHEAFRDIINVPLVEKKQYEAFSDKQKFLSLCSRHDLEIPPELFVSTEKEIKTPSVAKPKKEFTSSGKRTYPYILKSKKDLMLFLKQEEENDFFFQDFVEGPSYYILFYFSRSGEIAYCAQQNGLQQPGGKSILYAWTIDPDSRVVKKLIDLFAEKNFTGFSMVELIKAGNKYYIIECNPRMWGPFQLMVDSRAGIMDLFIKDYYDPAFPMPENTCNKNEDYLWLDGIFENSIFKLRVHNGFWIKFRDFAKSVINKDIMRRGDLDI